MRVRWNNTSSAYSGGTGEVFKKRTDDKPYVFLDKTNNEQQSNNDCGDTGSEGSGLRLVVDLRGESEEASDEGE